MGQLFTTAILVSAFLDPQKPFDYTFWGFWVNAALVLGTLVIAVFAVIQALAAKENARAAELNAKALIEGQRAQIAGEAHDNPVKDLLEPDSPRVQLALTNLGSVPAYDFTYESWIELLPSMTSDFTDAADHFVSTDKITLYPKHNPLVINIPIRAGLSSAQLSDLKKLRLYACVRVRAEFRDVFQRDRRYANFGFYVMPEGFGFLPKYNDSN
jgi:hypothetical protein